MRTATFTGSTGTVNCSAGERATGGGYRHTNSSAIPYVNAPVPGTAGQPATGWTVVLFTSVSGTGTVYAICVAP